MKDEIKNQIEFVEWLKENGLYNPMESALVMSKMHNIYLKYKVTADAEIEELKRENKKLIEALEEAVKTLENVEIFVKSRQRINRPTGEEWFNDQVFSLKQALKEK
jgi:hypothetical protein